MVRYKDDGKLQIKPSAPEQGDKAISSGSGDFLDNTIHLEKVSDNAGGVISEIKLAISRVPLSHDYEVYLPRFPQIVYNARNPIHSWNIGDKKAKDSIQGYNKKTIDYLTRRIPYVTKSVSGPSQTLELATTTILNKNWSFPQKITYDDLNITFYDTYIGSMAGDFGGETSEAQASSRENEWVNLGCLFKIWIDNIFINLNEKFSSENYNGRYDSFDTRVRYMEEYAIPELRVYVFSRRLEISDLYKWLTGGVDYYEVLAGPAEKSKTKKEIEKENELQQKLRLMGQATTESTDSFSKEPYVFWTQNYNRWLYILKNSNPKLNRELINVFTAENLAYYLNEYQKRFGIIGQAQRAMVQGGTNSAAGVMRATVSTVLNLAKALTNILLTVYAVSDAVGDTFSDFINRSGGQWKGFKDLMENYVKKRKQNGSLNAEAVTEAPLNGEELTALMNAMETAFVKMYVNYYTELKNRFNPKTGRYTPVRYEKYKLSGRWAVKYEHKKNQYTYVDTTPKRLRPYNRIGPVEYKKNNPAYKAFITINEHIKPTPKEIIIEYRYKEEKNDTNWLQLSYLHDQPVNQQDFVNVTYNYVRKVADEYKVVYNHQPKSNFDINIEYEHSKPEYVAINFNYEHKKPESIFTINKIKRKKPEENPLIVDTVKKRIAWYILEVVNELINSRVLIDQSPEPKQYKDIVENAFKAIFEYHNTILNGVGETFVKDDSGNKIQITESLKDVDEYIVEEIFKLRNTILNGIKQEPYITKQQFNEIIQELIKAINEFNNKVLDGKEKDPYKDENGNLLSIYKTYFQLKDSIIFLLNEYLVVNNKMFDSYQNEDGEPINFTTTFSQLLTEILNILTLTVKKEAWVDEDGNPLSIEGKYLVLKQLLYSYLMEDSPPEEPSHTDIPFGDEVYHSYVLLKKKIKDILINLENSERWVDSDRKPIIYRDYEKFKKEMIQDFQDYLENHGGIPKVIINEDIEVQGEFFILQLMESIYENLIKGKKDSYKDENGNPIDIPATLKQLYDNLFKSRVESIKNNYQDEDKKPIPFNDTLYNILYQLIRRDILACKNSVLRGIAQEPQTPEVLEVKEGLLKLLTTLSENKSDTWVDENGVPLYDEANKAYAEFEKIFGLSKSTGEIDDTDITKIIEIFLANEQTLSSKFLDSVGKEAIEKTKIYIINEVLKKGKVGAFSKGGESLEDIIKNGLLKTTDAFGNTNPDAQPQLMGKIDTPLDEILQVISAVGAAFYFYDLGKSIWWYFSPDFPIADGNNLEGLNWSRRGGLISSSMGEAFGARAAELVGIDKFFTFDFKDTSVESMLKFLAENVKVIGDMSQLKPFRIPVNEYAIEFMKIKRDTFRMLESTGEKNGEWVWPIKTFIFYDVYPYKISNSELSFDTSELQTFTVSFKYSHWEEK